MKIPLLDLNAQNLVLEAELKAAFERVLRSGQFILGPEVATLEAEVAEMTGAKHAVGVSSGTDAILLALMALGIRPGDEVLCPSFTFFATAGCVARVGATPIFVDSLEETFNIDVRDAARKVTTRTRAIIPVHLFGQSADMDGVLALAKENGLTVIEDGAQALGARYRNQPVGSLGDFGTFSFFPSKNLGGFGDGGMLVCNDDKLAAKAVTLRAHGSKPKYYHGYVGGNFRLDALQAALLRVKLPQYSEYTRRRKENAAAYLKALVQIPKIHKIDTNESSEAMVLLPTERPECNHIWNQFTLRIRVPGGRNVFRRNLEERGVGSEIYYPVPMDAQECFAGLDQTGSCPVASMLAKEVLSIPIYPELGQAGLEAVVGAIDQAVNEDAALSVVRF
jgi:dTDP-4-amino-4,6-dideoxygalactose transaminase